MPYIPHSSQERKEMLDAIGVRSAEELFRHIPNELRFSAPPLPRGLSEYEVLQLLRRRAGENTPLSRWNSFLGAGCYDHYVPAALSSLVSLPQFVTAYTPYQPECSQGILQAIFEYQSFICLLTGKEVTNASLLDGATALGEAVRMALRLNRRGWVLLADSVHPEYKRTLRTYLSAQECICEEVPRAAAGTLDISAWRRALSREVSCCVVQAPNFFGLIEDAEEIHRLCRTTDTLLIVVANPLSLALFQPSGDLICGDIQPFGCGVNFGGPGGGYLAASRRMIRQLPGRIVGRTVDAGGNDAFCLTLQTREQHIRREKATSNICSNHSLQAIAAAVYLSLQGSRGLTHTARQCVRNTQYLYRKMKGLSGVTLPYGPGVFHEFVWQVARPAAVLEALRRKGILGGYPTGKEFPGLDGGILSCCTEKKTKQDIDAYVSALEEILHGGQVRV
ncbi:MAG: aminomethyl-transferring glycine dehydrogenase subunit GcvPA [Candidatus Omnitrophica bacterium]|nr:aminomethyl-transferring glycine dehydrogenase subunit GcvPA [Candidatus Omnitrophota bacterium]